MQEEVAIRMEIPDRKNGKELIKTNIYYNKVAKYLE